MNTTVYIEQSKQYKLHCEKLRIPYFLYKFVKFVISIEFV